MRGPASETFRISENRSSEAVVARNRKPLHFVLVGVGRKAQQFGDAAVKIAQRIGKVLLLFERHAAAPNPASASRSGNRRRGRASARWPVRTEKGSRPRRHAPGGAPPPECGCAETARAISGRNRTPATGRTTATASTCSAAAPASSRHLAMECSGRLPCRWLAHQLDSSMAAHQSFRMALPIATRRRYRE